MRLIKIKLIAQIKIKSIYWEVAASAFNQGTHIKAAVSYN